MAISDELRAQILRYHFVEHWRVGTIASQLGVHHYTVEREPTPATRKKHHDDGNEPHSDE